MIDILDEMKTDFLVYASEVNNNRSFPDARDGLKVVQRASLWEMYSKGFGSHRPHVKCAKVAGGTIASWHPHSDGSVYDTIVRMSQPWINNIPEIDFHGANGSLQGGPEAASSRYTECRLSKVSEEGFFSNIKKDTVDMIANFSEDDEWPSVLPAIFPRLFINGSQGIGYTLAQEWEPHNLNEFSDKVKQYIETGNVTFDDIYPDYPSGGVIINKSDLKSIYETGKGSIVLRGKTSIEGNTIKITELPYQTYAEPLIQKIKDLVNNETLTGIEDICNKSDDNGLLIEVECSSDPKAVLIQLFKQTDLQTTFSANQIALLDGVPQAFNLKDYIKTYIDHNINCIVREYRYDLKQAEARLEVVEGLLRALASIDEIIITIKASKSSDDARTSLMNKFRFSEVQAKAIVDMRLGRLANLEQVELNKEAAELHKKIDNCNKLLNSSKKQTKEFLERLDEFVNKYGFARRTEVIDVDTSAEVKALKAKADDTFKVVLSKDGYLKRMTPDNYKKMADESMSIDVSLKDRFILISKDGFMYKMVAKDIDICNPKAQGQKFDQADILAIYRGDEEEEFLFMITKDGLAKKISAKEVFGLSKCVGAIIMKVNEKDKIIKCDLINSARYVLKSGSKKKTIYTDDFLAKGRGAGGVVALKPVKNSSIEIE